MTNGKVRRQTGGAETKGNLGTKRKERATRDEKTANSTRGGGKGKEGLHPSRGYPPKKNASL